ncbi:MAG: hypothetical protein KDK33_06140 [Leptospiraceae bacterium]|nr:hypothetical protein [Leptospiraceae bacterium]
MKLFRKAFHFFKKTVPAWIRQSRSLSVAVDHPFGKRSCLVAMRHLRPPGPLARILRIRKKLLLRPHGARLTISLAGPPLVQSWILRLAGRKIEDYFYYLQRRFRLRGLNGGRKNPICDTPLFPGQFPVWLSANTAYWNAFLMLPQQILSVDSQVYRDSYPGPDLPPFHLGPAHRVLGRTRSGHTVHEIWQEALLHAGDRRYHGLLVRPCAQFLDYLEYTGRNFEAAFRQSGFPDGRGLPARKSVGRLMPLSSPTFPALPFDRRNLRLFYVDASLRIHVFKAEFMDPVNHRLHFHFHWQADQPGLLDRMLNRPRCALPFESGSEWVYSSSMVLEMEKECTIDVLECDYRHLDTQIVLKATSSVLPVVHGRN